jgi:hypothetical protein
MKSQRVFGAAYRDWGWKASEPKKTDPQQARANRLKAAIRRLQYKQEKP